MPRTRSIPIYKPFEMVDGQEQHCFLRFWRDLHLKAMVALDFDLAFK